MLQGEVIIFAGVRGFSPHRGEDLHYKLGSVEAKGKGDCPTGRQRL